MKLTLLRVPVLCFALASGIAADGSIASAADRVDGDAQDIVIFAPSAPRFVRLHIQVDGRGFSMLQAIYSRKLFAALDGDGDGLLDLNESKQIPAPSRYGAKNSDFQLSDIDAAPKDDTVSPDELIAYIRAALGTPFRLVLEPPRSAETADLFLKLDADANGRLTNDELLNSRAALAKYDLDDDETISLAELIPGRNPTANQLPTAAETAADSPFVAILPDTVDFMAGELLKRYDRTADGRLSADECGVSAADWSRGDSNSDGGLNASELAAWLGSPVPQLEFLIRFKQNSFRGETIGSLTDDRKLEELGAIVKQIDPKTVSLVWDGIEMQLVAKKNLAAITGFENRQLYRMKFLQADGDRNRYLEAGEFAGIQLPNISFEMIDENGDQKLFADELVGYIDREADLSQSRTSMTIASEGVALFEILDRDQDGRLTPRELLAPYEQTAASDTDGDGALAQTELRKQYVLTVQAAQIPVTDRRMMAMNEPAMARRGMPAVRPTGPLWFRKMDNNQDGDVTPREFLGTPDDFSLLDSNADGLIDPVEAARIQENGAKNTVVGVPGP